MQTYIAQARMDLFGSDRKPFRTGQAAADWLKRESEAGMSGDYPDRLLAIKRTFSELSKNVIAAKEGFPVGLAITVGLQQSLVAYAGEDRWTYRVLATTPLLVQLAEASEQVARVARCNPAIATMAILTNAAIGGHTRLRRTFSSSPAGSGWHVGLETDQDTTLRPDQVAQIWRQSTNQLSVKDRRFLEVIRMLRSRGLEPPSVGKRGVNRGVRAYWEEFIQEWNKRLPRFEQPYAHWTSAKDHYRSIQAREKSTSSPWFAP
jgi:hypothetical protein